MPNKIVIHSVPRSGSSWLGEIINSAPNVLYKFQPLFSYEFKGFLGENSSPLEIETFFQKLAKGTSSFLEQTEHREQGKKPKFDKIKFQHIAYKEVRYHNILKNMFKKDKSIKGLFLIRNPLSVLASFKNAPREFKAELAWDFEQEWRFALKKNDNKKEEYNGYEKWKEAANIFYDLKKQYPSRVYIVSYDTLTRTTLAETNNIFEFLGIEWNGQTDSFLTADKKNAIESTYSVYRAKIFDDNWKKFISEPTRQFIYNDLKGTNLEKYLPK
jgi:hypothetical protein